MPALFGTIPGTPPGSARTGLGALFVAGARAIVETQQALDLAALQAPAVVPETTDILPPLAFVVGSAGIEFNGRLALGVAPVAGGVRSLEFALASRVDQTLRTAVSTRVRLTVQAVRPSPVLREDADG